MMFGFGFLFMLIVPLLIIGAGAWLVLALVRGGQGMSLHPSPQASPLEIVKARYARGEITKEQFDAMRKDLTT